MSLAVAIKGPEGVVLAADSRVTLEVKKGDDLFRPVNFDNATKLLRFSEPHCNVGAVTYGLAVIGQRTAHSFIPEFEVGLRKQLSQGKKKEEALGIQKFAEKMSRFYLDRWNELAPPKYDGPGMMFIVGGYDPGAAYGKVFLVNIPGHPEPIPQNPGESNFGMTWGGQLEVASRIVHGYDPALIGIVRQTLKLDKKQVADLVKVLRPNLEFPIPFAMLPLQDCVDLATFLIRSTMTAQRLAIGVRGVGGPIDVAIITRKDGLQDVQQKAIHGESSPVN